MPPKGSGKWPNTPASKRDRDRVLKLVYAVGRERLRFNTYHLRAAAAAKPALTLECSRELYRHLRALNGSTLVRVGARNESVGGGAAARYGKSVYVLRARIAELDGAPPELDDIEKALRALWVAVAALGGAQVPTGAVTAVLQSIEDLAPESGRRTADFLRSLSDRAAPLAERIKVPGERQLCWLPIGSPPEDDRFDGWVEQFKALNRNVTAVVSSGHATVGGMVEELVGIALARSRSTTWPAGHSITVRDLDAVAGADDRAAELTRKLRRRKTTPAVVLGDLTREIIAGAPRVERRVVKVKGPLGTGTYYDCLDIPGFERRRLFVQYQALRFTLTSRRIRLFMDEFVRASALSDHEEAVVRACGAVRTLGVWREAESWDSTVAALEQSSALLSKKIRDSLVDYRRKLQTFERSMAPREEAAEQAASLLAPFRLTPEEVLDAPRPLVVAEEYASWFPEHMVRGLSPVDFLARARALTRYPNPHHTQRRDPDPTRAAATCVDRVEAMLYAAGLIQTPTLDLLQAGAGLLGRFMRHPGLLRIALSSKRPDVHRAALAGLVLLADPSAEDAAWEDVERPRSPDSLVDALHALLVLEKLDLKRIPMAVRQTSDRYVQSALRQIVRAARQGRSLLQHY